MATNFPNSPSNGDTHAGFTYNSTKGVWESSSPRETLHALKINSTLTTVYNSEQAVTLDILESGDSSLSHSSDGFTIPRDGVYNFKAEFFTNSSLQQAVVEAHILIYVNNVSMGRAVEYSAANSGYNKGGDGSFSLDLSANDHVTFRVWCWAGSASSNNTLQITANAFHVYCTSYN